MVGPLEDEPWHLAAHLDDEARYGALEQLRPTLVRWAPPADAPPHLAVGLDRLRALPPGETVFLVAPGRAPETLLERMADARRAGATVVSVDGGDPELDDLVHERFTVGAVRAARAGRHQRGPGPGPTPGQLGAAAGPAGPAGPEGAAVVPRSSADQPASRRSADSIEGAESAELGAARR